MSTNVRIATHEIIEQESTWHPAFLLRVLVPTRDNGGIAFPSSAFVRFEDFLDFQVGAYTARAGSRGSWRNERGERVFDGHVEYEVLVRTRGEARALAEVIHDYVLRRFLQEAVMMRVTPTETLLDLPSLPFFGGLV